MYIDQCLHEANDEYNLSDTCQVHAHSPDFEILVQEKGFLKEWLSQLEIA
jgi:hypothetical protein